MKQVALFSKDWFSEETVNQMSREKAIRVVLHSDGKACIRNRKEVEDDRERHPENYSRLIIKSI